MPPRMMSYAFLALHFATVLTKAEETCTTGVQDVVAATGGALLQKKRSLALSVSDIEATLGAGSGALPSPPADAPATAKHECHLDAEELATQDWLMNQSHGPVTPNGVHAQPNECSEPDALLGRDVTVNQWFGVPKHITGPIVEVGANVGRDLRNFLRNYPTAQVFSYEPMPNLTAQLKTQPEIIAAGQRVHIRNFGVGGKTENVTFEDGTDGRSEAISAFDGPAAQGAKEWKLPVVALPEVLSQITREVGRVPEAISFNCEGCEYPSMVSFIESSYLGKVRYLQFSWHMTKQEGRIEMRCRVESALRGMGYQLVYWSYFGWQSWALPCKLP